MCDQGLFGFWSITHGEYNGYRVFEKIFATVHFMTRRRNGNGTEIPNSNDVKYPRRIDSSLEFLHRN